MKTSSQPLVSIITVTFNLIKAKREQYFRQCLESVHNQTYPNIEHIIIDGASTDGTIDLIKEYSNKNWVRYISEPDSGIYDAMNKGIGEAKGEYVAFLNSDDYYHDIHGVEWSVSELEKTGMAFSYAPVIMMDQDGKRNRTHPQVNPDIKSVFYTMPFCHQTMFTRRDVLIKEKMFNKKYDSAGDYDLVLRLCLKEYKSVKLSRSFTTFRLDGLSNNNQIQSLDEVSRIYHHLYGIDLLECKNIYNSEYLGISPKLAKKLKKNEYFDYTKYVEFTKDYYNIISNLLLENRKLKDDLKRILDSRSWKIAQMITKLAVKTHLKK